MALCAGYTERKSFAARHAEGKAVLLYNHIPKCAGLSLTAMLRKLFPSACGVHQNIFDPRFTPLDRDFYHGHGLSGLESWLAADKSYYYITFLRHPWELAQSLIRFFTWLLPLDAYYAKDPEKLILQQEPNLLIEYLGNGDKVLAEENLLQHYAFFGLQEHFSASIALLSEMIPDLDSSPCVVKNVSDKEKCTFSPAIKEAFFEKHADDIALYEKAKAEFLWRLAQFEKTQTSVQKYKSVENENSNPPLAVSHAKGDNLRTVLNLKESIALNEDLPAMDMAEARFENWLHILAHSMQNEEEYRAYFQWLMQRVPQRLSCLFFAYHVAVKANLPELAGVAQLLFKLCQERDAQNNCRIIVACREHIAQQCIARKLFSKNHPFMQEVTTWNNAK